VIPGIDTEPVQGWSKARQNPLVRDLIEKGRAALNIHVSVLEHQVTSKNFQRWEQLNVQAKALLKIVDEFIDSFDVSVVSG
jgi:hypothetical protein